MLREQVSEILRSISDSILGFAVEPAVAKLPKTQQLMAAKVYVSGTWSGLIGVECATDLARRTAELMFELDRAASPDEIVDALGEVTNIIAGNLKALLPGPSQLSLPAVAQGQSEDWDLPGVERMEYCSGDQAFTVIVYPEAPRDAVRARG